MAEDGLLGFRDREGNWAIEPRFDAKDVVGFRNGLCALEVESGWGFIDRKGEWAIQPEYLWVGRFSEGLVRAVSENGFVHYLDRTGERRLTLDWPCWEGFETHPDVIARAESSAEANRISVESGERVGVWITDEDMSEEDRREFIRNNPPTTDPRKFIPGYAWEQVMDLESDAGMFSEGLASAAKEGRWGFINKSGEWVVEPRFEDALHFSQGLAGVRADGKWGFINRKGEWVIEPLYEEVDPFEAEGYTMVTLNDEYIWIDLTGRELSYEELEAMEEE
jgi:hypothetical protein